MINKKSKIYIAGHRGMVGSSLVRLFKKKNFQNIITKTRKQLDLTDQKKTYKFLNLTKPDVIIIAAAKVGGIYANNEFRADFLFQNLQIQNNLINGGYLAGVKKIIFLGSSCIYPRVCKQPIKEEYLLTAPLEYTNEPYALAKIAGVKLIENYNKQFKTNYLCLMPCNLYGPNDNYNLETSHFLPALLKKIHYAKINNKKSVLLWGTGSPKRELMHVNDLSGACIYFMNKKTNHSYINIGSEEEFTIKQYAKIISKMIGYSGKIKFDPKMPDGTPRKLLDCSLAKSYGWESKISLLFGLKDAYEDYLKNTF